jgi:uncharacterized protein (TIGR02147 family)
MLAYVKFRGENFAALGRMLNPPIRDYEAKKAMEVLQRLGFIIRGSDGAYRQADTALSTGRLSLDKNVAAANIVRFQEVMTDLGKKAFERCSSKDLDMSTLTLSVSKQIFLAIKDEMAAFRKKLASMAQNDSLPDRVYQLNYQMFPLTRIDDNGKQD